jgi:hypothetical protein
MAPGCIDFYVNMVYSINYSEPLNDVLFIPAFYDS